MDVRIYSRAEWGARYSNGEPSVTLSLGFWRENWLHHTGDALRLSADATFEQECAEMRRLEKVGQDRFGQGMSYTTLIFPSGRAFEGHSLNRRGAHTYGHNDAGRAICYPGNYSVVPPSPYQVRATAEVLRYYAANGGPGRLSGGHRDVYSTECPGDAAYSKIQEINALATSGAELDDDMATPQENANQVLFYTPIAGPKGATPYNLNDMNYWNNVMLNDLSAQVPLLLAQVTGLSKAVELLAAAHNNADEIAQAVRGAIEDGIVKVQVTVENRTAAQVATTLPNAES